MAVSEKEKALQTALAQIEKQFGKGAVMKLGQNSSLNVEAIPTGSLSLDIALGIGGVPRGRIIEIYGPESSGKTTVALHIVAEAQKMGGEAVFIDVVVVDSVAAMTTKAEIEGEMGDSFVGLQARLMSQALRKLTGAISKSNAVCIFINQLREKIGVMYGNPETTPGGRALKFYSSVRLDIRKKDPIKEGGEVIGNLTKVKVVKNKVAPPFREAEFDIMYGEGISREGEIVDLAVKLDIIKKSGSWYSYEGTRIGQGRDKVKQYFKENPEFAEQIAKQVMDQKERLMLMAKGKKKEKDEETGGAAEMPEEAAAQPAEPMAEKHDPLPDLDDDFGGQKVSSSSLIDIEADDK